MLMLVFLFKDTATTELYTYLHTLSLHDARPIFPHERRDPRLFHVVRRDAQNRGDLLHAGVGHGFRGEIGFIGGSHCLDDDLPRFAGRSEEHTSELQSLMRTSYAVFCLKKKKNTNNHDSKYPIVTTTSQNT